MRNRPSSVLRGVGATSIVAVFCIPAPAAGQRQVPPSALVNPEADEAVATARAASLRSADETFAYFADDVDAALASAIEKVWDPERAREPSPRTPWGHPDLRGYWINATYTPLERRAELAGKPLYSIQEAIEAFQAAVLVDAAVDPATVHYDWTEFGMDNWQSPIRPNRRTALIVDPPDGQIPALTPAGRERWEAQARRETMTSRHPTERCIVGSEGPPRVPFIQQIGESRIIQTPDYVVLITQSNSDVRIIPLGDQPEPPAKIRAWLGVPRGHWEGDTLVIETTNFHEDRTWVRPRGVGGDLHLLERVTRVADDMLLYEATLSDPTTWEAPWTMEIPWPKMEPPGLFEWACHEHNYGIINVLKGAQIRAEEYEAQSQD